MISELTMCVLAAALNAHAERGGSGGVGLSRVSGPALPRVSGAIEVPLSARVGFGGGRVSYVGGPSAESRREDDPTTRRFDQLSRATDRRFSIVRLCGFGCTRPCCPNPTPNPPPPSAPPAWVNPYLEQAPQSIHPAGVVRVRVRPAVGAVIPPVRAVSPRIRIGPG